MWCEIRIDYIAYSVATNVGVYFLRGSDILGLALDAKRGLIYYTDFELGIIAEITTNGSNRREIFSNSDERPRAIAVDSNNRWNNRNRSSRLSRSQPVTLLPVITKLSELNISHAKIIKKYRRQDTESFAFCDAAGWMGMVVSTWVWFQSHTSTTPTVLSRN